VKINSNNITSADIIEIINEIYKISDGSLSEKILEYCHRNDLNPQELGDILYESEDFKKVLYRDCVVNNIIQDEVLDDKSKRTQEIFKW